MTALEAEAEDNTRLRKAVEFIAHCMEAENQCRKALADAVERTKLARSKHEIAFNKCEARAVQRRKAGLIETNPGY